jgi:hypothetical protein
MNSKENDSMSKSVGALLAEAEQIMTKHASKKSETVDSSVVLKLAEQLRKTPESADQSDLTVKIAEAIAIVDTLINLEEIVRVAHFEGQAKTAGFNDEQISEYVEKKASPKFVSVVSMIPWLNRG